MQVKASYERLGKAHTQITLRNKLYVNPRPLAEEFTLLTEQMDIFEVLRKASNTSACIWSAAAP
jgi:hypothetical protein